MIEDTTPPAQEDLTTSSMANPLASDLGGEAQASNPMAEEMNRPWEEAQAKYQTDLADYRAKAMKNVFNSALDWDRATAGKPVDLSFDVDPERAKNRVISRSFLQVMNDGQPIPGGELAVHMAMVRVDEQLFGGRSKGDEQAFAGEIRKRAEYEKGQEDIRRDIQNKAALSAAVQSVDFFDHDTASYDKWTEEHRDDTRRDPAKAAEYIELWNANRDHAREKLTPISSPLRLVWNAIKEDSVGDVAADQYYKLTPSQRADFAEGINMLVQALPKEEQPTVLGNLAKITMRGHRGLVDSTKLGLINERAGELEQTRSDLASNRREPSPLPGNFDARTTEVERQAWIQQNARDIESNHRDREALNFSHDMQAAQEKYNPAKPVPSKWLNDDLQMGLYQIPNVIEYGVAASIPYAGPAMLIASSEGMAYSSFRDKFMASGLDSGEASRQAERLAPAAGALVAGSEFFGAKVFKGAFPIMDKFFTAATDQITNKVARFGARWAIAGGEEFALERSQDFVEPFIQAAYQQAGAPVPGVDLHNQQGTGVFDGFWSQNWQTFGAVAPLGFFAGFGGINADKRARAFAKASDVEIKALGIPSAEVPKIRDAIGKGLTSAGEAIDHAMQHADAKSPEALAAVKELLAQKAAVDEVQRSGLVPKFVTTAEGTTVIDPENGKPLGPAGTVEEAQRIAAAHSTAVEGMKGDRVTFLATMLQAQQEATKLPGEENTTFEASPGETRTTTQQAAESYADSQRVADQLHASEVMDGGDGSIAQIVVGSSRTTFDQDVRETVNRLFNGATVVDVVHEVTHGKRKAAMKAGALTREEQIAHLRSTDTVLAGKVTKNGEALAFLRNVPDAEITETELDEAVSKYMESEAVRTRNSPDAPGKMISGPVITENIKAAARLISPEASRKFSAFARALRDYFGVAFSRAFTINSALKSGKLDAAAHDRFVSKLMGLQEQDGHDAKATVISNQIAGTPAFSLKAAVVAHRIELAASAEPLQLSTDDWAGLSARDRRQRASAVAVQLQKEAAEGKPIINAHRATEIQVSIKGMKHWTRFAADPRKAALIGHLRELLERAIFLRSEAPDARKEGDKNIKAYQRLALPTVIDGQETMSMVTVRTDSRGHLVYDGRVLEIEVPADRSETSTKQTPADRAVFDIQQAREDLLHEHLKVNKALATRDSFSLRPAAMADALSANVASLIKNPVEKSRYFERVLDSLGKVKRLAADGILYGAEAFSGGDHERALSEIEGRREATSDAHDKRLAEIDSKAEAAKQEERAKLLEKFGPQDGKSRDEKKAFTEAVRQAEAKVEKQRLLDVAKSEKVRDKALASHDAQEARLATKGALSDQRQTTLNALAMMDGILGALPADLRGKVGGFTHLASLTTDEAREKYFKDRIAKIETVVEDYVRKQYGGMMAKLLKRASPSQEAAGKKPKGKATPETHALFNLVKQAIRWNAATADSKATALEAEVQAGVSAGTMSAADELEKTTQANAIRLVGDWNRRYLIGTGSNGKGTRTKISDGADSARRVAAFKTLENLWNEGYAKAKLAALQKAEDRKIDQKSLQAATGKAGTLAERQARIEADSGLKGWVKENLLSLSNFEQLVHYTFGKKSEVANRLIDLERRASDAKEDAIQAKMDAQQDFYTKAAGGSGYAGETLRHSMATEKNIKLTGTAEWSGLKFTQNEGVAITMMWRQEDGRRHMEGLPSTSWHYDQAFVDQVEAQLTPEAQAFRGHLTAAYAGEYAKLNPVFKKLNNANLPQNALYSPLTVKPQQAAAGQVVNPVTGFAGSASSTTPGSLKTRGIGVAEPDFRDALQTYIAHTKEVEHYIAYAETANEATQLLNNRDVMNSVLAKGGKEAANVMRQWVDIFAQGGARDAAAQVALNGTLSKMVNRASSVALVGRASVVVIQSLQLGAGLAEMPAGAYAVRLAKLFTGQLDWFIGDKSSFKSDYIQRRLGELPPLVRQAMEGLRAANPTRVKYLVRYLGKAIGGADALFTAGTYAMVYDYQLGQAKTMNYTGAAAEEWAHSAAERATDRVAQPTKMSQRSLYENVNTSPLAKLSWAFASEARQKIALAAWALASKDVSAGQKLRTLAVTWGVGGMGAAILRAALRDIRSDDDDEVFDERNWSPKRLILSSITGPLQGIPVLGSGLESAIYKAAGEYQPEGNLFSNGVEAAGAGKRLVTADEKDTEHTLKDVEAILTGLGLFNEQVAAAGSLSHLARDIFQVGKNFTPR